MSGSGSVERVNYQRMRIYGLVLVDFTDSKGFLCFPGCLGLYTPYRCSLHVKVARFFRLAMGPLALIHCPSIHWY
jgi:hypothetical protein